MMDGYSGMMWLGVVGFAFQFLMFAAMATTAAAAIYCAVLIKNLSSRVKELSDELKRLAAKS